MNCVLPIWRQRLPLDVVAPGDVLDVVELWVPRAGVQVLEPEPLARLLAQQLDDDEDVPWRNYVEGEPLPPDR